MYLPIFIIRIDERTEEIFFLAGEETAILIFVMACGDSYDKTRF
jgi:hypothetical protein